MLLNPTKTCVLDLAWPFSRQLSLFNSPSGNPPSLITPNQNPHSHISTPFPTRAPSSSCLGLSPSIHSKSPPLWPAPRFFVAPRPPATPRGCSGLPRSRPLFGQARPGGVESRDGAQKLLMDDSKGARYTERGSSMLHMACINCTMTCGVSSFWQLSCENKSHKEPNGRRSQ